jgi:thioredoxin-like negative regulator of GroEL
MYSLTLQEDNRQLVFDAVHGDRLVVACLCAAWCGTCGSYRTAFESLALKHPDMVFLWVDVEDHADVVGDLDVDNFPTLLIQRRETVAFFGPMLPDPLVAERLVVAVDSLTDEELATQAQSSEERRTWQREANLRALLHSAG